MSSPTPPVIAPPLDHQPVIGVCGPSGGGKSSSLENLPADTTHILDIERKGFPFDVRRFKRTPVASFKEFGSSGTKGAFHAALAGGAKVIVIEGLLKLTHFIHAQADAAFKGFDVFKYYNKWIRDTMEMVKNPQAIVIITGINELVTTEAVDSDGAESDKLINCFAVATGKELRGKIEQDMLVVLHTHVKVNKTAANEHFFVTSTDGVNTAKSPTWMKLPKMIPNDLGPVVKQLQDYYGGGK